MRDILFRGKRIDNGEWVEGFYVMYSKYIAYPYSYTNGEHTIVTVPHNFKCKIDFETICQYTGLTDKNGNKIFEGDIVKHKSAQLLGVVKYSEKYMQFIVDDIDDGEQDCSGFINEAEIIGNIFDNPELLEVD